MTDPPPFTAPITQYAEDAYAYLEPLWGGDDQRGFPLKTFMAAIGEGQRQVEEVARAQPGRDPFQQAWDVTRCPPYLLPFLGQAVGVSVTAGLTADAQRLQIMAEAGFYRGSVQNIIAAGESQQTAPGHMTVIERDPDAWGIVVAYDPAYTPNTAAFTAAVKAAVPWGLALTFIATSVPLFDEGTLIPDTLSSSIHFDTATLAQIT
jgi:hypothetical protein